MPTLGAVPDAGPAGVGRRWRRWRVALLPPWARRMYSLPGLALTDAAATAALKAFRQTLLRLPQRARRSPIVWAGYERVAGRSRPPDRAQAGASSSARKLQVSRGGTAA